MKIKTIKFDDTKQIKVLNVGDVHYGNPCCDRKAFKEAIDYIKLEKDCYWISTGDLLEVAIKDSLSDVYKSLNLYDEIKDIVDLLEPIKHKCLGIVGSNHHYRVERKIGLNLDALLCEFLQIPYLGIIGYLRIIVGNIGYFVALHHGYGAGRTKGSKVNKLENFGNVAKGFDVYMMGHVHFFDFFIDKDLIIDKKHNKVVNCISYYITTSHFLNYRDSYGERLLLDSSPKGCAMITLFGGNSVKNKKVKVDFFNLDA